MKTVDDIFVALGGTGAVAKMIDVKHSAASEMRRRASIPVRYWPDLIDGARAASVEIDSNLLVAVHVGAEPAESHLGSLQPSGVRSSHRSPAKAGTI